MEEKINKAAILKDKPKGTKLYTILSDGECFLNEASEDSIYIDIDNRERFWCFSAYGSTHSFPNGCVLLFPSREMRDWSKFAWKKGDLLINSCGLQCIFKEWASDDYTKFNGCYSNSRDGYEDVSNVETAKFVKFDNNTAYGYIREIENRYGGKLNLESLEIEKTQPEFKDGDVLFVKCEERDFIEIFNYSKKNGDLCDYASLDTLAHHLDISGKYKIGKEDIVKIRLATEEEKKQFFSALEKEGKAWDSDKKQIVDLPKKCEFKVFEKVLVRESKTDEWTPNFFFKIHRDDERYVMVCGDMYNYCIPYNEETAHLLGTTDEWKGGEG